VLDRQRLGKQRVEALQIITALYHYRCGREYGWQNHPATKMWLGRELSLGAYGLTICDEWVNRGYQDSCASKIRAVANLLRERGVSNEELPWWWGDDRVHQSHKSNLLRKLPTHYRQFWARTPDNLPYFWPSLLS
jgi:hypothetical protein